MTPFDPDDRRPKMSAEAFRLLRDDVHAHCGIYVRDDMQFVMERRLWPRLEALGLTDFEGYHRYLRFDANRRAELETAVEILTTHETYFFREPLQLSAFSDELLPMLSERAQSLRRLRIWSAGCSTGEEPYTIAMILLRSGLFPRWDLQVFGSDISKRVLQTARRAEYGPASMRACPTYALPFFESIGADRLRVREDVRAMVSFGHLNLVDASSRALVPKADVIFCRNVMIYFDVAARRRALEVLYDRLVDGGFLLLGHSESLINLSADFELVHLKDDLVYRRPEARR